MKSSQTFRKNNYIILNNYMKMKADMFCQILIPVF